MPWLVRDYFHDRIADIANLFPRRKILQTRAMEFAALADGEAVAIEEMFREAMGPT